MYNCFKLFFFVNSDRLSLNLPEKDTEEHTLPGDLKFRNRKKVSVSEFENALQQRLNYTTGISGHNEL